MATPVSKTRSIRVDELFDWLRATVCEPQTAADVSIIVDPDQWCVEFAPGRKTRIAPLKAALEAQLRDAAEGTLLDWRIVYVGLKSDCYRVAKMLRKNIVSQIVKL